MDNQQNQSGSPMPGDDVRNQNAGNTTGSTSADASGTGASGSRKSSSARGASAQGSTGGQAGDQRNQEGGAQGEGQPGDKMLNSVLESGKKWIEDSGVLNSVNQLPQSVKEWGSRAATRVGDLTTTQKIVGGALLAVGLGYLATRKGKSGTSESRYDRQSSGSYGRRSSYGYQAPDASNSRRTTVGSGRSDSGSAYGNSGSGYGSSGNYNSGSSYGSGAGSSSSDRGSSSYGSNSDRGGNFGSNSDRGNYSSSGSTTGGSGSSSGSGFGSPSSGGDFGSRTSEESSYRSKHEDFRSIE
ncbi:hypothetical protein Q3A66_10525 [Hymenobacter sp. BT770]|uniref:hypothetical protein n=1 Tax=Hymenobacter sp. BT770 TaxID=2886942 RepID=UPI001D107D9D|nr:hypothetical protein [Hymenobacter sp. BT770]MCC3153414.1 hypothetical protein [Hymenobacter sp. BT770]MDO3415504.1 hypothetical protein [Hymenobacter sp. BT770]